MWCYVSKLNHYDFGNRLIHKKTFKVFLEAWQKLDELSNPINKKQLIRTLGSLCSPKFSQIIKNIISYRNDPDEYLSILKDFNNKDFSYLNGLSSQQTIHEKNKFWDALIVKYNLFLKNE